jgi:transcriptional regulator with AAA-type ATPase domain/predicted ATPase
LRAQIRHLAAFDTLGNPAVPTVLLQGETGTGKGLVARVLHDSGPRAQEPFLDVNCAAIPETLLEAELFGVTAGAFTDAKRAKPGLFEAAARGTLFLDEIDALPLALQGKLLTAIEAKRVRRVGAVREQAVDVKVVAATQADLRARVAAGQFRTDLYHRLAVIVLVLPPLRERGADIERLAQQFLQQYAEAHRLPSKRLSPAAAEWLQRCNWPGNVRELSHLMERVTLFSTEAIVDPQTLERLCLPHTPSISGAEVGLATEARQPLDEAVRIRQALRQTEGNVERAARLLGLSRKAVRYRMRKYGITRVQGDGKSPRPHPASPGVPVGPSPSMGEGKRRGPEPTAASPPAGSSPTRGEGPGKERADRTPRWEQKLVAVLALDLTWPAAVEGEALRYEPWTATRRWEQAIAEKVQGFGGVILQRSPSLLVVAFGMPRTLEQLPQRAVQAALAVQHLMGEDPIPDQSTSHPEVRQAVHLGQIRVDTQRSDPTAPLLPVGEALALPVRLLGHAAPGEILVSSAVGRWVGGWFALQARTGPLGRGPSDPIGAYAVVGLKPGRSPLALRGMRPRSQFVGRARELATLDALLEQATEGRGQVVGLVGEPGVGKSRLLYEVRQRIRSQPVSYLEGHCLAYASALPYGPVLDLLRQHCGMTETDDTHAIGGKVRTGLQRVGMDAEEGAPYLLPLLGVPTGTNGLAGLSPEVIKARTFATLRQLLLHGRQRQPLVLAVENLHWIDLTSEAFLAALVEHLGGARVVLLVTYRPGYRPPWIEKSYATQIVLPPLSAQDSRRMLEAVLPTATIPDALMQQILAKGQGNPFFLEEIVQALMDQGVLGRPDARGTPVLTQPPPDIQIPPTVQGVLAARLDQLAPAEKALLQTLAVISTSFRVGLLRQVVEQPAAELDRLLAALQATEFLYEQPTARERAYTFKHILTQEVAYASLPEEQRRVVHARTAQAIEALYAQRLEDHYGALAHHYRHSGHGEQAVVYHQRAGQQAIQRSAYPEAISLLTTGLELLQTLPDTSERSRQELDVQLTLGQALMVTKGQASSEVQHAFTRAYALCQQVGETAQLFAVLRGLRVIYVAWGPLSKARELAEQILSLAQSAQDAVRLASAHAVLGDTLFFLGEFASARAHLEQGRALSDSVQDASDALRDMDPIGVRCRRYGAWTLWYLGYPNQALQLSDEAITVAQEWAHPYVLAWALFYAGILHGLRREAPAAQERAEATIALARQHEFRGLLARGTRLRGWALAAQGQGAEGVAQMHQGLTAFQAAGEAGLQPLFRALLAEMYMRLGQAAAGLSTLDEELAQQHKKGNRWYEAELYRLKGELLLGRAADDHAEAEACFLQALDVARRQQAKSLELRAAMSLSRLWDRQSKRQEARQLLVGIYSWFTEGFDTADLQDAKALLAELSEASPAVLSDRKNSNIA